MQLHYFHMYGGNQLSGINKKILFQSKNLNDIGLQTQLILMGGINDDNLPYPFIKIIPIENSKVNNNPLNRLFMPIIRQISARKCILTLLRMLDDTSIVYLRYPIPLFITPIDISHKRQCKLVLECNSIEIEEQLMKKSYFSFIREYIMGKLFRERADAIVGVTQEITNYQIIRSGNPQIPHITISNGIDTKPISIRHFSTMQDDSLHIIFVAVVHHAHGLDRLIQGLALYKGTKQVILHIVGEGSELPFLQTLTNSLEICDQVIFHGFTTGEALDALFDECHIAVGSLGIHRKGLTQTSELKAREYCARGIPYIIAVSDPDFPPDFPYILQLPPDESPINIEQVIAFADEVLADPDHPQKMRAYAEEHLDWSVKMKRLKGFLEELVGEERNNKAP